MYVKAHSKMTSMNTKIQSELHQLYPLLIHFKIMIHISSRIYISVPPLPLGPNLISPK